MIFKNIPSYPLPFVVRNSLTNPFYQNNLGVWKFSQKKVKKFPGPFSTFHLLKCPNFINIFADFWKWFFRITLAIPHPSPSGIHWQINFSKKIKVWKKKKKKVTSLNRNIHSVDSWPYTWSNRSVKCLLTAVCSVQGRLVEASLFY